MEEEEDFLRIGSLSFLGAGATMRQRATNGNEQRQRANNHGATMKLRLIKRFSSYFTEPSGQKYVSEEGM